MFGLRRSEGTESLFEARLVQASVWTSQSVDAIARTLRAIVDERGSAAFGISGGSTPVPVFEALADADVPWGDVTLVQVDERCVPLGDPARNLTSQQAALGATDATWLTLPVGDDGAVPDTAQLAEFAASLDAATNGTGSLDLVQLGLGADGHTGSLVPGDPVLDVDAVVAVTDAVYAGHRRVTLTIPTLQAAHAVVWLVTDVDGEKARAYEKLRAGDPSIPAGRLELADSLVIAAR
ncbi:MAG: 6-phosphogluconolactonase [Acidimicrobiales bacterium]